MKLIVDKRASLMCFPYVFLCQVERIVATRLDSRVKGSGKAFMFSISLRIVMMKNI